MAFTCGPHHLDHGAHILVSGREGGVLDLISIAIATPAGVIWFLLRAEALLGGRGDRRIAGTPLWMDLLPIAGFVYVAALLNGAIAVVRTTANPEPKTVPNLLLVVLYSAIGAQLARTQLRNRPHTGGWSVSGTSLATVMFTCALMHGVYALYATSGRYDLDGHGYAIDILSVPAAAYFLWVVWALHHGRLRDWNDSDDVDARRPVAPSPRSEADALVGAH
ncbi:MAG: hypothetical protein ACRDZU_01290, partial [Acidimicrobiales bacterium]